MRGIPNISDGHSPMPGIIPAHAGHTCEDYAGPSSNRDHPRTCGAYSSAIRSIRSPSGSSPHMRGILKKSIACNLSGGIIPAHAGHTVRLPFFPVLPVDHPRTCGAYQHRTCLIVCIMGSSPHMRGIPNLSESQQIELGIIPAHAGHTVGSQ